MRFAILGSVTVVGPRGAVPVTAPRELALLAELLVHAGRPVTREHLADRIWGEQEVRHPAHAVHTLVCRLRRRLDGAGSGPSGSGPGGGAGGNGGGIETSGRCYTLGADEAAVDALRFRRLVGEARHAAGGDRAETAADLYGRALALWRGAALTGVPAGSRCVQAEQLQLDELRVSAVEERAELQLRLGGHDALVGELVPLVAAYPFRERLRAALMLALYRSGQVAEALQTYQRASSELVDSFGISPGADLRRLHDRMLHDDPALRPAAAGPEPAPVPLPAGRLRQTLLDLQGSTARLEARVRDLETALAAIGGPGRPPPPGG